MYSEVYDRNNPNIALNLRFRDSADATDFESILKISTPPVLSWSNRPDSGHIYNIFDTEPRKNYKGILVTHTRLEWKYNERFYLYRDTDYIYSRTPAHICLPLVRYTYYIISHVEKRATTWSQESHPFSLTKSEQMAGHEIQQRSGAQVQLWRKDGMETRLLARWENTVQDKWLGLQVERDAFTPRERMTAMERSFPKSFAYTEEES
ncbi:MAG: hypothetical protein Q9185_003648 [Variospora sp. 1 TL-2023]